MAHCNNDAEQPSDLTLIVYVIQRMLAGLTSGRVQLAALVVVRRHFLVANREGMQGSQ